MRDPAPAATGSNLAIDSQDDAARTEHDHSTKGVLQMALRPVNPSEERRDQSDDPLRRHEHLTAEVGAEGGSFAEGLRSVPGAVRAAPATSDAPAYANRGAAATDMDILRHPSDPAVDDVLPAAPDLGARTLGMVLGFGLGVAVASVFCVMWMWRTDRVRASSTRLSASLPD